MQNHGTQTKVPGISLLVMYMLGETMARNRRDRNRGRSEETFDFSNDLASLLRPTPSTLPRPLAPLVHHTSPTANPLSDIEDRRYYHPAGPQRPASSLDRPTHRLVIPVHPKNTNKSSRATSAIPTQIQFEAPKKVLVCIRRGQRKQVLHALKLTGKGSKARRHKRTEYSGVKC